MGIIKTGYIEYRNKKRTVNISNIRYQPKNVEIRSASNRQHDPTRLGFTKIKILQRRV